MVQQAYAKQPDPSHSMELGVALLWLRKYASAWEHYRSAIDADPARSGDNDYGMAGVAKWCLGKPDEAVAYWRAGLAANYARVSGLGVIMPLLLFFVSVVKPETVDEDSARKLLLEKTRDLRIRNWPGPIARFVLAEIDDDELQDHCQGADEQETRDREWLAEFYRSLLRRRQMSVSGFKDSMHKLTDTTQPEWQDEAVFLSRIWNEEYFLARHATD
jgi:tetratricopeptide (TPR) repeat protein